MMLDNQKKKKKKKKTIILLISGLIVMLVIGTIAYFAWPKNNSIENKQPTNSKEEIQRLQTQLSSLKQKINNLLGSTKKTQLENKLTNTESQVSNLSNQKSVQKSTIKKIEEEIEKIKKELEGDKPDKPNDNPPENPGPSQNKLTKYIVEKVDDNTFKYRFTVDNDKQDCRGFDDVKWWMFISLLKGELGSSIEPKNEEFFKAFQGALKDANSKFPAYFWKCPPVSKKTLATPFEFVVIKSDTLNNIKQDWTSFGEHISPNHQKWVCSFPSKGSGNTLIIPIPKPGPELDFKNISQFTKNAPDEQQQALWKEVANKLMEELEKDQDAPRWLNTEGTSAKYLHVRIDKTNRFYSNYPEYAKWE